MLMSVEKLRDHIKSDESDEALKVKLQALESLIRNYTHNNFQITGFLPLQKSPKKE